MNIPELAVNSHFDSPRSRAPFLIFEAQSPPAAPAERRPLNAKRRTLNAARRTLNAARRTLNADR
jgi:hypothetical protein